MANQVALPKTKREWMQSWLMFTPPGATEKVTYRLHRDTDDTAREISWDETDSTNVWGEQTSDNRQSGQNVPLDPYDTRVGDPLTLFLHDLDERQADMDEIAVEYGEVTFDMADAENPVQIKCFTRPARLLYTAVGGSSAGSVVFTCNIKLVGHSELADFNIATNTFTPRATTP